MQTSINTENNETLNVTNVNTSPQPQHYMAWSIENEEILIKWCDYAQCYKWLNYQASIDSPVKWFT